FMVPALGQGLLISSVTRNQFLAAQIALFSGFLPAFMLSGFLYEIDAMPAPIRIITLFVPARYFVSSLQTVFLAGDIWAVFLPNLLAMGAIGVFFFLLAKRATRKNLEQAPCRTHPAPWPSPGCAPSSSRKCSASCAIRAAGWWYLCRLCCSCWYSPSPRRWKCAM